MSLLVALIPVIALIAMLAADVIWFGEDSSYGANQMALLIAALIAGGIGFSRGTKWKEMRDAIASSIGQATEAILILLLIGALAGTWLMAGIIPAFIHYGLLDSKCDFSNRFNWISCCFFPQQRLIACFKPRRISSINIKS